MNRFHLFFMFLSALLSGALHYTVNVEGKIEREIKKIIYIEAPAEKPEEEKERQPEKEEVKVTSFEAERAPSKIKKKESENR